MVEPKPFTGWLHTDCKRVACPQCGAQPEEYCRTPLGRKCKTPHASRTTVFLTHFKDYSEKTCLPAVTAALKCAGRNPGGLVSNTTSTSVAITFK